MGVAPDRTLGWYVRAARMLVVGLAIMVEFGVSLIQQRSPESSRHPLLLGSLLLVLLWMFLEPLASPDADRVPRPGGQWRKNVTIFLPCACFALVYVFAKEDWAAFASGQGMGWLFWGFGKVRQRSYFVAAAGWALAGIVVFLLPWPNGQRQEFVFVLGGLATALQGIHELIRELKNPLRSLA